MPVRTPLPPPGYLPHEVAAMAGVDIRTLGTWRKDGKIDFYLTPGRRSRYPRESTDAFIAARLAAKQARR